MKEILDEYCIIEEQEKADKRTNKVAMRGVVFLLGLFFIIVLISILIRLAFYLKTVSF